MAIVSTVSEIHGQAVIVKLAEPAGDGMKFPAAGTLFMKKQNVGKVWISDVLIGGNFQAVGSGKGDGFYPDHVKSAENPCQENGACGKYNSSRNALQMAMSLLFLQEQ
jgi:hypothetical protein